MASSGTTSSPSPSSRNLSPQPVADASTDGPSTFPPVESFSQTRSEGLFVDWQTESHSEGASSDGSGVDIVIVHGLYGNSNDCLKERRSPGSGSSKWVNEYANSLCVDARVLVFKYDFASILLGSRTRRAIHDAATHLLDDLVTQRNKQPTRSIIVVGHDIGGIIMKDALALASLHGGKWQQIYECTRILIFCGCPHRGTDKLDLQEKILSLVYGASGSLSVKKEPALYSIQGLTDAVLEINGLFVESKIYMRSQIVSIHAEEFFPGNIHPAVDGFTGVMGLPMERRIAESPSQSSESDFYPGLDEWLDSLKPYLSVSPAETVLLEDMLISLAFPTQPLTTAHHPDHLVHNVDAVTEWIDSPGGTVLHISGIDGMRESSEQIFHAIQHKVEDAHGPVNTPNIFLYFLFDSFDIRRDSLNQMLATLVAQIVCHNTAELSDWKTVLWKQFLEDRCWTTSYLMNVFRRTLNLASCVISCVICFTERSSAACQKDLLSVLSSLVSGTDVKHRIAVTSQEGGLSTPATSDWKFVDLGLPQFEKELGEDYSTGSDVYHLLRYRPDLKPWKASLQEQLSHIAGDDKLSRHLICEQIKVHTDWEGELQLKDLFPAKTDRHVEEILDASLRKVQDGKTLRRLLTWIILTVRPLTVWELVDAMHISSGNQANTFEVHELVSNLEAWLPGVVAILHNEVQIPDPRLRGILTTPGGSSYVWDEIRENAQTDLTETCLRYISLPSSQVIMEDLYHLSTGNLTPMPSNANSANFCSYAVQFWPHHFSQTPTQSTPNLLAEFSNSDAASMWLKAYWALSNPVTRPDTCWTSVYPVFIGLELSPAAGPHNAEDTESALFEALKHCRSTYVTRLLKTSSFSQSILLQALKAAVSGGNEDLMLQIFAHLGKTDNFHLIEWPMVLLETAVYLGLDRFADMLLTMGYKLEHESTIQREGLLLTAAYYNQDAVVRILLKHGVNVHRRDQFGQGALHHAMFLNSIETARALKEEGYDGLEDKDENGQTALYVACRRGNYKTAKYLLELGADPDMGFTTDQESFSTPLVTAAEHGHMECVRALVQCGANLDIPGPSGVDTPLRYAVVNGHTEICRLLLEKGADPNCELIRPPILVEAITFSSGLRQGNGYSTAVLVEFLNILIGYGASVNALDIGGQPALAFALNHGDPSIIECLLDHGADANIFDNKPGALDFPTGRGEYIIELLLARGADPDLFNSRALTPLMCAASVGHAEAVRVLLKNNATVELEVHDAGLHYDGFTALSFAASYGHADVTRMLADVGADLQHRSADGYYPIHQAATSESLRSLLEYRKRINIDQIADSGETALHRSIRCAHVPAENLRLLVNAGVALNTLDHEGYTPLMCAIKYDDEVSFSLLLKEKDIDIHIQSPVHGTALHVACRYQSLSKVQRLVERGADVNLDVSGYAGTPLQITCFKIHNDATEAIIETILQYLITNGAEVGHDGRAFGSAINVAARQCWVGTVKYLADQGASVDVPNEMGILPIHYAADSGIKMFLVVLEAGGDLSARDKLRRSPLHWAAQNGRAQVVEHILSELGSEVVNDPDIDGWTPLCFAARGLNRCRTHNETDEPYDPERVIELLIQHEANRSSGGTIGLQQWSPLRIARYGGASSRIQQWLESDSQQQTALDHKTKAAGRTNTFCDSCLWSIRGVSYRCTGCFHFDFCEKCYNRRDILHANYPDHGFEEFRPRVSDMSDTESVPQPESDSTSDSESSSSSSASD